MQIWYTFYLTFLSQTWKYLIEIRHKSPSLPSLKGRSLKASNSSQEASKGALNQGHVRLTKNDSSRDSLVQHQGGQKIDLIDVEIQPRSDTVKILSHRKTRKIISADLNSIIDESKSETRLKTPGELKRQFFI